MYAVIKFEPGLWYTVAMYGDECVARQYSCNFASKTPLE